MTEPEWSAASFVGAREATARAAAGATPQQRWAWLNEALTLAQAGGALDRVRRQRQREVDATVPDEG